MPTARRCVKVQRDRFSRFQVFTMGRGRPRPRPCPLNFCTHPLGHVLTLPPSAGGPRPQHIARSRWSGAFLSISTSYAAADRAFATPKWLRPRRRDGPRSGGGGVKIPHPLSICTRHARFATRHCARLWRKTSRCAADAPKKTACHRSIHSKNSARDSASSSGSPKGDRYEVLAPLQSMNPPLTPPRRGPDMTRANASSPPGRGWGWVGSRKAPRTLMPCIGTMQPLAVRSPGFSRSGPRANRLKAGLQANLGY